MEKNTLTATSTAKPTKANNSTVNSSTPQGTNMAQENTYQITYKYPAPNGMLRSAALVVKTTDEKTARKMATDSLTLQYPVFKITGCKLF